MTLLELINLHTDARIWKEHIEYPEEYSERSMKDRLHLDAEKGVHAHNQDPKTYDYPTSREVYAATAIELLVWVMTIPYIPMDEHRPVLKEILYRIWTWGLLSDDLKDELMLIAKL
jgi:hypothetical protein